MTNAPARKRVLCIRPHLHPEAGPIRAARSDAWVEALGLHAEVRVVDEDFDLDWVCSAFRPDLIVLDGLDRTRPGPLAIANPRAFPQVPRLLFLNGLPYDPRRVLTLRMAEALGVEAVFATGEAHVQYMPELRRWPCFGAPHFIDERVFRDEGLQRVLPVSFFGGRHVPGLAAWHAQTLRETSHVFPSFVHTHPEAARENDPFAVQGETYARLLNQSVFAAADTTRLDDCGREHLEIPACGAILIAPHSDTLASYGFVDMQICILGMGAELHDKMRKVANDPEERKRISEAGRELVARRYTRQSWRGMLEWLDCRERLKPSQIVQQIGRYGPFRGVTPTASTTFIMAPPQGDSVLASLLGRARNAILSGRDLAVAEEMLTEAASWTTDLAEPAFLLALIALLKGDPITAAIAIGRRAQELAAGDMALGLLDPLETAWLMLIGRLIGNAEIEAAMREQAAATSHLALRRMVALLDGTAMPESIVNVPGDAASVHWLGIEDDTSWTYLMRRMLQANAAGAAGLTVPAPALTTAA